MKLFWAHILCNQYVVEIYIVALFHKAKKINYKFIELYTLIDEWKDSFVFHLQIFLEKEEDNLFAG